MSENIRQHFRKARRALPEKVQREHANAVKNALDAWPQVREITDIGCYLASDGEVDLGPSIERFWKRKIRTAVPVVHTNSMSFCAYTRRTDTVASKWGIREPITPSGIDINDLDIVLVPVVAFTNLGQRLGRGRGFYDRTFASSPRPILIGVAHEIQRARLLNTDDSDVRLDGIVSENGLIMVS
ncbi:MAG: 5-formyltetrahydrofolate cyclo-ligase [Pseudomonadota bacterium]|nr:5-formyltetrahydrofolate cyclo-ligase [Pseudomonadota bacterium]